MLNVKELDELAVKYNTDKGSSFQGNRAANNYISLYVEYFNRQGFTKDNVKNILEVGTNTGASLRMWAEFFPNANVYGIDITRQYELPGMLDSDRIKTAIVDQSDRSAIKASLDRWGVKDFDIIIDDGSHEQTHQQVSLGYLFAWLRPGGLYVVEDLITGENWFDSNTYNIGRITPTRGVIQTFQQTGQLNSSVMNKSEVKHIKSTYEYCEYREATALIYGNHHPQIAFMGKKNG